MRIKLVTIELAESIPGEASGIVHQQADRLTVGRRGEDRIGAGGLGPDRRRP